MLFVKCILQNRCGLLLTNTQWRHLKERFQNVSSTLWIVTELNIFVSVVFIILFHEINRNKYFKRNRNTLIQFAHLGKKIACFILIRLFARVNYDLNCNSVCSSRPFTSLEKVVNYNRKVICWKRFCWVDCSERFETNCPLATRFHRLWSWSTMIYSW